MKKIDLVSLHLSPREDIDDMRVRAALSAEEFNPFYLILGGEKRRMNRMTENILQYGIPEERVKTIDGLDNYFLGFEYLIRESLMRIEQASEEKYSKENPFIIGITTNIIGQERLDLYFDKAKNYGIFGEGIQKEKITSDEPASVLDLERIGLEKDKKVFSFGYLPGRFVKKRIHPMKNSLYRIIKKSDPREIKD